MGILSWIILGALTGWIASKIMGMDAQMGGFANIIVGVIGAFVGGLVMSAIGKVGVTDFSLRSLFVALIGSVIFLAIYKAVRKK